MDFEPFGGKMPDDWKEINLSDIATFVGGYSYKGSELQTSSTAMATIKNFDRQGGFKLDGFKEILPSSKLKETQKIDLFDILVAHTDLTQNADVIGNAEMLLSKAGYLDVIISMDIVKVLPQTGVSKFLLAALLKDNRFKQHSLGYINGTTVLHLSKKALPEYTFAFPNNVDAVDELTQTLEYLYKKLASNIEENTRLAQLRDTLLPKLISGEIDVSDVNISADKSSFCDGIYFMCYFLFLLKRMYLFRYSFLVLLLIFLPVSNPCFCRLRGEGGSSGSFCLRRCRECGGCRRLCLLCVWRARWRMKSLKTRLFA